MGDIEPEGIDTYIIVAEPVNNTGEEADGFIVRLNLFDFDDIITVFTESYPEYVMAINPDNINQEPLNIWWHGSSTANGAKATFSFESSKPINGGSANWLDKIGNGLGSLAPTIPITSASSQILEVEGRRVLAMSVINRSKAPVWIQRRFNTSQKPFSVKDMAVLDRVHPAGQQLDSAPVPVGVRRAQTHARPLERNVPGYSLSYDLYEDKAGVPGKHLGTFAHSVNVRLN